MKKEFYPNEPTCKAIGITDPTILLDKSLAILSQGVSLVAKCRNTGKMLGLALNEKTMPWDIELYYKLADEVKCKKIKTLLKFYAYVLRSTNLFEKFNVPKVFEITNLSVALEAQGMGIGNELVKSSQHIALNNGFKLMRIDASSLFTARICEKMNMELISEIPYNSYLDENGLPVFDIPLPHVALKTFILRLPDKNILRV
ncbi:hypothetical protein HHI36_011987 [Cryptolaemus montrouzieri]|uniref:aralkylamine N-acetyltransferase n=1 Tax=Cryptolaemus montrouzieri TaxID=559131 RepID=A0ABD2NCY9_9CUCU